MGHKICFYEEISIIISELSLLALLTGSIGNVLMIGMGVGAEEAFVFLENNNKVSGS